MNKFYTSHEIQEFFDELAPFRDYWINKNKYYYKQLSYLHQFLVERNSSILEIGCGTGNLLGELSPKYGEGIDFSFEMIKIASKKYPQYTFRVMDAHNLEYKKKFDYVILNNLVGYTEDIWQVFRQLRKVSHERSRIVITNYNYFWQPILAVAEKLHLKMPDKIQNWLPVKFIEHFLYLNGFEVIKKGKYLHIPIDIPFISAFVNTVAANLPFLNQLGMIEYIIARPTFLQEKPHGDVNVSIIVPTYEEAGNIDTIVDLMPEIGTNSELIFVDFAGIDQTAAKIKYKIKNYRGPLSIKYVNQGEKTGKIGALRLGYKQARGEIILVYDADVTVPPDDLTKFYLALVERRGELINGTRFVYPTEKGAVRFINHVGNLIFAYLFTKGLEQHFTDTLCGSKGFWKKDFDLVEFKKRTIYQADKFGDFYLLLEAYRRNYKIAEVPVRYKMRRYGDTKLNRFRNGLIFLKMFTYFYWFYKILRRKVI